MPAAFLASVPDNTQGGANLTFFFPVLLFIIIAGILYFRVLSRPHPRVPARRIGILSHAGPPSVEASHAAAVAAGLPLAEGGGSAESGAEAAGARSAALAEADAGASTDVASTDVASTDVASTDVASTDVASDEVAESTPPADDAGVGE